MILIAHDDPVQARAYAHVLRSMGGYATEILGDAKEVVGTVRRLRPELLFISDDFGYKAENCYTRSYDVVAEIRKDPDIAAMPIVMFCHLEKEGVQATTEAGCVVLTIPVHPEEVMATVRRLLGETSGSGA